MSPTVMSHEDVHTRRSLMDAGASFVVSMGDEFAVLRAENEGKSIDILLRMEGDDARLVGDSLSHGDLHVWLRVRERSLIAEKEAMAQEGPSALVLRQAGFEPRHMGGGLMGWVKELDGTDENYLLITNEGHGLAGEASDPEWTVGRYAGESWVAVAELDLTQAVEAGERLPLPAGGEETIVKGLDDLEGLLADRDHAAPRPA